MRLPGARSRATLALGRPHPWWVRVRSAVVPENGYCCALLISSALIVEACGWRSKTVPPVGFVPQTFSDHIWTMRPTTPAVSGVAAEVPPKLLVYVLPVVVVKMLSYQ